MGPRRWRVGLRQIEENCTLFHLAKNTNELKMKKMRQHKAHSGEEANFLGEFCEKFWVVTSLTHLCPKKLGFSFGKASLLRVHVFGRQGPLLLRGEQHGSPLWTVIVSLLCSEITDVREHLYIQKKRAQRCYLRLPAMGLLVCKW